MAAFFFGTKEGVYPMTSTGWTQTTYDEAFESTLASLRKRRLDDPGFTAADARGILRHLYVQEGNDQGGRGGYQDAMLSGMIHAHERFLSEWDGEAGSPGTRPEG